VDSIRFQSFGDHCVEGGGFLSTSGHPNLRTVCSYRRAQTSVLRALQHSESAYRHGYMHVYACVHVCASLCLRAQMNTPVPTLTIQAPHVTMNTETERERACKEKARESLGVVKLYVREHASTSS